MELRHFGTKDTNIPALGCKLECCSWRGTQGWEVQPHGLGGLNLQKLESYEVIVFIEVRSRKHLLLGKTR